MIALAARNLHVSLGNVPVLHGADVAFQRGCWTAVVGPNGAGKSTLLKALAGLIPANGQVQLLGEDIHTLKPKKRAQKLAWLGQTTNSGDDGLSVYDTVMLGRLPHQGWLGSPTHEDQLAVEQALQITHTSQWRERLINALSGGERQRVLLARVLAVHADVILMDEPLANVDPPHQADWVNTVRSLTKQGKTVITVLHELNVALAADYLLMMKGGEVSNFGACADLSTHHAMEELFSHRIQVRKFDGDVCVTLKLA